ncbi:MAG TPA: HIT domain-containing protein [Acidimicrobiales bacterium]|nr:HIT domain-containing protein [Acidimicrobiales bacterium]
MTAERPGPALDRLWAGWRTGYIQGAAATRAERGSGADACVFCAILASGEPDEATHVVWRHPAGRAFALLNAYPYGTGHLLVLPTRHVADLEALDDAEAADLWAGARAAVAAVKAAYHPDGVNLGANLGEASGAGVPGHLHLHVLPRWSGDTNFMTAVAEARVLPEPLSATAAKLRAAWPAG